MNDILKENFNMDVFEGLELSFNILVGNNLNALHYEFDVIDSIIRKHFNVIKVFHNVYIRAKEEEYKYRINIYDDERSIILELIRSVNENNEEEFFRLIVMNSHPRFVATFLKLLLERYSFDGFLYGYIDGVFVGINRQVLREDLSAYTDEQLSNMLYEDLPGDHLLYKIDSEGWVDDSGKWHDWP